MNALVTDLRRLSETVLDEARPFFSLRDEVLALKSIFQKASGSYFTDPQADISAGEIRTESGAAISPTMAAMCVDDFGRTVQFLRGLNSAIRDVGLKLGDRHVRVLYAGCGPWATLVVPLMSVWTNGAVRFTLLDIHSESIASAKRTIDELRLSPHVEEFITADAAKYQIDDSAPYDIVLIEMLRAALEDEPQVAVARHLIRECPNAVMIPESVRIDLALVDRAKEFETSRDRVILGTALSLENGIIRTHSIRLPAYDDGYYTPMLLTSICVHGKHVLRDYDSGVTCPRVLRLEGEPGVMEFAYETGKHPRLSARRVSTD